MKEWVFEAALKRVVKDLLVLSDHSEESVADHSLATWKQSNQLERVLKRKKGISLEQMEMGRIRLRRESTSLLQAVDWKDRED
jgi:hypothetical protein